MKAHTIILTPLLFLCVSGIGRLAAQDTSKTIMATTANPSVTGVNNDDLATVGDNYLYALYLNALVDDGTVNYINNGNITTNGVYAFGIHVLSKKDIDLTTNGNITTSGSRSDGIHSKSDIGESKVTIGASSTIKTIHGGATGVFSCVDDEFGYSTSDAIIINNGSVITEGGVWQNGETSYVSYGLRARNFNDGHSRIVNNGSVTVTGSTVKAIFSQTHGAGNAYVYTGANSVITANEASSGAIRGQASGSGHIYIGDENNYLQGTATANGASSYGIQAYTYGSGNAYIYNNATITANGANSFGAQIAGAGAGGQQGYLYNTGSITGDYGVHIHSGINGGRIENRGTIEGRNGTAIRLDGGNIAVDLSSASRTIGNIVSNNGGNTIVLSGDSGSAALNNISGGTVNFTSITKTGNSIWSITQDIEFSGSGTALTVQAGKLAVSGAISFEQTAATSRIMSGATLAGTGSIMNAVNFESAAVLEVNLADAMAGQYLTIGSGSLDGDILFLNWASEELVIGSRYTILESTDGVLSGQFGWSHDETRFYGANEYKLQYGGNTVELVVVGHAQPIPEPAAALLGLLATAFLAPVRRR